MAAKISDLYVVIEELIANGIEIEAPDELGRTAAETAKLHNNTEAYHIITKYVNAKHNVVVEDVKCGNGDITTLSIDESFHNQSANSGRISQSGDNSYDRHADTPTTGGSRADSRNEINTDSLGSGGRNSYRFSHLFDQTIIEENKNSSSSNSTSSPLPNRSNSFSKIKSDIIIYENPDDLNEPIYSNCDSPDWHNTAEVRDGSWQQVQSVANSKADSAELSDQMSELDEMLHKDLNTDFELHVKPTVEILKENWLELDKPVENSIVNDVGDNKTEDKEEFLNSNFLFAQKSSATTKLNNLVDSTVKTVNQYLPNTLTLNGSEESFKVDYAISNEKQNSEDKHSISSKSESTKTDSDESILSGCTSPNSQAKRKSYAEALASPRKMSQQYSPTKSTIFTKVPQRNFNFNQSNGNQKNFAYNGKSRQYRNNKGKQQVMPNEFMRTNKANNYSQKNGGGGANLNNTNYSHQNVVDKKHSPSTFDTKRNKSESVSSTDSSSVTSIKHKSTQVLNANWEDNYNKLLISIKHLLYRNSNPTIDNSQNEELSLLKNLSVFIYESNQQKIELELKQKEVALLKSSLDKMQHQVECEQKYCKELENKIAQRAMFDQCDMINGNVVPSEQHQQQRPDELSTTLDFMNQHYNLRTKHYESVINDQLNENFALKKQCHFLTEQLKAYESLQPTDGVGEKGSFIFSTAQKLGASLNKMEEKLTLYDEMGIRGNEEESRVRTRFIEQMHYEVSNLKEILSQLITLNYGLNTGEDKLANASLQQQPDYVNLSSIKRTTSRRKKLGPRKSFSMHDLANIDLCEENDTPANAPVNTNLHLDYACSFSYKSKYFQHKINELRKQLGTPS